MAAVDVVDVVDVFDLLSKPCRGNGRAVAVRGTLIVTADKGGGSPERGLGPTAWAVGWKTARTRSCHCPGLRR